MNKAIIAKADDPIYIPNTIGSSKATTAAPSASFQSVTKKGNAPLIMMTKSK